jgi:hypothetical protein
MARDYSKGKIYKIEAEGTDEIYVGSTIKLLCQRMAKHREGYKLWKAGKGKKYKSFDLFDKYGVENCKIVLIELYPCSCKAELERREGECQKQLIGKGLVNKKISGRTKKEYRVDNKDKIKEQEKKNHSQIVKCECGCELRKDSLSNHKKSKKHLELLKVKDI